MGIVVIVCSLLSAFWIPAFVALGFAIYLGVKGGEIAVQRRLYGGDQEFVAVERAWTIGGVISVAASIVLSIVLMVLGLFAAILSSVAQSHY